MRLRSLLPGRGERRVLELADVAEAWSASPTAAGVSVTPENSLRLTAVYGCVRVLSEAVASLPFPVYRRQERSRVRLRDDPRWRLLNEEPNPEQTAFELWQMVMTHLNLYGNGYLAIDTTGGRLSLWPLDPRCSWPERDETTLRLRYRTRLANGDEAVIPPEAMIHVRGLVVAGDVGLSPIGVARHAIGAAVATEEYAARFFANDATPRTFISLKRHMDEEKQEEFRRKWEGGHRGLKRAHLLGVVTGDADIKTVGIPPEDAQLLDTRKLTVREVARIFRVPPYMLADMEPGAVSYASVEQQSLDFVVHSLRPWLVRIEQAIKRALFAGPGDVRANIYPEFQVDGLLRGDTAARYAGYAIARQWGWLSANDIRELENMPAIPGGDVYLEPAKTQPADDRVTDEALARLLARPSE